MKILQLTSHLNIGGITQHVLGLSKGLRERGHHLIIASDNGSLRAKVTPMGLTHWQLPFGTSAEFSPQVFWGIRDLAKKLQKEPVDLMHAHTRVSQVVSDQLSHRLKIPYVTTWHGIYKRRLGRRLWPCMGLRTIAISDLVRRHLFQDCQLPIERICCIPNGIDVEHYATPPEKGLVEDFRQRWKIPTGRPIIGAVGRLAAGGVKGFDLLLAAASLVKQQLRDVQVLIVGDGPRRWYLENFVKRLGLKPQVHFVGICQDVRIPLALMDLFVFTSRWPEAFGLSVLEAMAAGKPVIATEVGAVPEIIHHGVDGLIVPPEDIATLVRSIVQLLNDHTTANELARQAHRRVREAFSLQRMANEIEAVYQKVKGMEFSLDPAESTGIL